MSAQTVISPSTPVPTAEALDRVGSALVEARKAVVTAGTGPDDTESALVALCRASYDALLSWEPADDVTTGDLDPTRSWRRPLDELRVQVALAEMELREFGVPVEAVRDVVTAVSDGVAAARRDLGDSIDRMRAELRKLRS